MVFSGITLARTKKTIVALQLLGHLAESGLPIQLAGRRKHIQEAGSVGQASRLPGNDPFPKRPF